MKHLKKFFEATDFTKEDILENFLFITDKLGEPEIFSSKFGTSLKWTIRWDIKLDLSVLQEASDLITKLKELTEDIDDVLAAADRIGEYNINKEVGGYYYNFSLPGYKKNLLLKTIFQQRFY